MDEVEAEVASHGESTIRFVKNREQLDRALALAQSQNAVLVSGDKHLLEIGAGAPILAPADLPLDAGEPR